MISHFLYPKTNDMRPDIYSFQETWETPGLNWEHELPGKILHARGSNNRQGVLLGFNSNLQSVIESSEADPEGRYIVVNVKIRGEQMTIVAMYIESSLPDKDTIIVLGNVMDKIVAGGNSRVLICGDLNSSWIQKWIWQEELFVVIGAGKLRDS